MKKFMLMITLFWFAFFAACSKKASPGKTVVKLNTYNSDIVPLLQAKCTPCHLPTKGGRKADFENYESAKRYGAAMLERVLLNPGDKGFMPFKHDKLPAEEIVIIKNWVDQGMLEK